MIATHRIRTLSCFVLSLCMLLAASTLARAATLPEPVAKLVQSITKEVYPAENELGDIKEYSVAMRDGVKLHTVAYLPKIKGPWTTILLRDPYKAATMHALAVIFAQRGYACVVQDARGTGKSAGEWEPFMNEREDGYDTNTWLDKQTWVKQIGTFGHSYRGYTQWLTGDALPPKVKTMFISSFSVNRYASIYQDGVFRHDIYTSWALRNSGIKAAITPSDQYTTALQYRPFQDMDYAIYGQKMDWFREYQNNINPESPYWKNGVWEHLRTVPGKIKVPVCLAIGWYDHHLTGMFEGYLGLTPEVKKQSRFLIGPWEHSFKVQGDVPCPDFDIVGTQAVKAGLVWFDEIFKGKAPATPRGGAQAYIMRAGEWQNLSSWPPQTKSMRFYLTDESRGDYAGTLTGEAKKEATLSFVYDPNNPVPTKGGNALLAWTGLKGPYVSSPGPREQDKPGARDDVLSFESDPLPADTLLVGNVKATLKVASDAEDTAFTVKIMEVTPEGKAIAIRDNITSLAYRNGSATPQLYTPGTPVEVTMELPPVAWKLQKGSTIRVDISSSNFPCYAAHSNLFGPWALQKDVKTANQTIHAGQNGSWIELPILEK